MRHRAVSVTLASSSVLFLLSGCATKHSSTSPTPSNNVQQEVSTLKGALRAASNQKYTQINESGSSSVGNPADLGFALPSHIKQTVEVDGSTAEVLQDSAPSIYESPSSLIYAIEGRWIKLTSNEPLSAAGQGQSVLSNLTASNVDSLFQSFDVKNEGTDKLVFTMVPKEAYRSEFFGAVSAALHRVMVAEDPYDWTMSVAHLSSGAVPFQSEKVELILTQQNGLWAVTGGTWDIAYTNGTNCSKVSVTESYTHKNVPVSIPSDVITGSPVPPGSNTGKHADGQIISLIPIDGMSIPNFYTSLNAYKMTYWSQGIPVVAYVAVPQQAGTYPLYVSCHGGWVTPVPVTHVSSLGVGSDSLAYAKANMITLVPMYRGYGDSQGPISGLKANTADTINAIRAIESKYHVEAGHIYLQGVSMGGGVVLKVASEETGIRSVVAISPYVGANIVGTWYLSHNQSALPHIAETFSALTGAYGPFNGNKAVYQAESIDYRKITAPTLLLQGTGDQSVQWQTVQTLYQDMKQSHEQVQLNLVQGANHGFTGTYASDAQTAQILWYAKYGEGVS